MRNNSDSLLNFTEHKKKTYLKKTKLRRPYYGFLMLTSETRKCIENTNVLFLINYKLQ